MTSVAVIGTGRMGAAMVARLLGAGHSVTVYNRTPARASATGAAVAATSREAAAAADIVIASLADDAAVQAVYGSLIEGLRPGAVVLETSTIHPDTVRALAPQVGACSATLLDAPVSGSVPVVQKGQLTFMVGGPSEALDRARPVLECLAAQVYHLGPVGAGATMKLAVNAVVHALNQAIAESLVLVEKSGIDRELAYDVLASSAVAAPYVHYKREAFLHPESTPVAFALSLVAKDLALIDSLATSVGARMDQLTTNRRIVLEALSFGYADRDLSALADLLRTKPAQDNP
ncbi:MAG TPA: NAD(P)-dependent oxidoreductase [Candidatus Limnocylindrales bacterium]|nr:NAD(P)-dependent oxidoreductase [Candidatus Limnocylindrales bacterium]